MTEPEEPLLLDHDSDGIRELDNQLPRWWVWLFNLTIAFSAVYLVYYHVLGAGETTIEAYEKEKAAGDTLKAVALARFESELTTLAPAQDQMVLNDGERVFLMMCAPCHRTDGGGLVGPNLTDDYWIHGSAFTDNLKVIWNGVPEKGMVSWKGVLKPEEIYSVASYVYSLRGTQPPNPKPPESQAPAAAEENIYE